MNPSLLLLLQLGALLIDGAPSTVDIIFSINVTTVEVEEPFEASCIIVNYDEVKKQNYQVKFLQDKLVLGTHYSPGTNFKANATNDFSILQMDNYFPIFQILLTSHSNSTLTNFWCQLVVDGISSFNSKHWYNNNSDRPQVHNTTLHFSANATKVVNNQPFLISCTIAHLENEANKSYSIKFYRASNLIESHLLGTHEVLAPTSTYPKQRHLFTPEFFDDLTVGAGRHFVYPNFELLVKPSRLEMQENFWCEVADVTANRTYKSNVWVNTPLLGYTITNITADPFTARCEIKYFNNADGRNCSVAFMQANTFLASYYVIANQSEVFVRGQDDNGRKTQHGDSFTYPLYEVIITSNSPYHYNYWCQLILQRGGRYRFDESIPSNKIYK